MDYDFRRIEKKWQEEWEKNRIFEVKEGGKRKFYCLEMFPYPSSEGLHMGHSFNYTIGDIHTRFKRMSGYNVLYPMGYDSLGLPAENAAIKEGTNPKAYTEKAIENFIKQQKALGLSYDWNRLIRTHDTEYYRWDQWIFLKMFEKGLAYRKKSPVNFCKKCSSVLANEQVHDGKCWRHKDTRVEIRQLKQWFFKITNYADELCEYLDKLQNWPEDVKAMQKNWIGKSYGTEINFKINKQEWPVFTTRADTIYGVTFMVLSAQHPKLMEVVTNQQKKKVEAFLKKIKSTSGKDLEKLEKDGVFTGSYATNLLTMEKVPVYVGNFVLAEYGSGMVMAVPAHDARDFEFAKKYKIPIKEVISPSFILKGRHAPRKNVETLRRDTVTAIIKHPKENKFLFVKEPEDLILAGGGIEKGETPEQAIIREIEEETGYSKFRIKKILMKNLFCYGFRKTKNKNQMTRDVVFLVELMNENRTTSEIDQGKHEVIWLKPEEALNKIAWEHHLFIFKNYLERNDGAFVDEGILINSDKFSGLDSAKAREKITKYLEKRRLGKRTVQYKLKDWLISRQRYWGTPIPIIYCKKCGVIPVLEKDLPVKLPEKVRFGKGNPLTTNKEFIDIKCPKCGGKARRETDTMDTFVNSSWYFLRYCDPKNSKEIFDKIKVRYWMPIDQYIGGKEHACMHLIYFRFYTKFLRDIGLLNFDEPAVRLFNQGMVHGSDGSVMSKSAGNGVDPLDMIKKFGADTLRFYLVSNASADKDFIWSEESIEGSSKFIKRIMNFFEKVRIGKSREMVESKFNKAIKEVGEDTEHFRYNLALIKTRMLFDYFGEEESKEVLEGFLKLLSPFCPHIAEELWHRLGNKTFISLEFWPKADESKINPELEKQEQQITQTIEDIKNIAKIIREKKGAEPKRIYLYTLPKELELYKESKSIIEKSLNAHVEIFPVSDKNKYDPQNKAGKAKPGKPAIYLE